MKERGHSIVSEMWTWVGPEENEVDLLQLMILLIHQLRILLYLGTKILLPLALVNIQANWV